MKWLARKCETGGKRLLPALRQEQCRTCQLRPRAQQALHRAQVEGEQLGEAEAQQRRRAAHQHLLDAHLWQEKRGEQDRETRQFSSAHMQSDT